jgi:hypothetical protein
VLTLERAVKNEHGLMQKLLVVGALIGQTTKRDRSDRYARPVPLEPANFIPGVTPLGKKHPGLI